MHAILRRRHLLAAGAALGSTALVLTARGRTAAAQAPAGTLTLADTLAGDGRFDRLLGMIGRAGFIDQLRGPGPLTLFAPTDTALQAAPANLLQDLLAQGTGGGGGGAGGGGGTLGGASPDMVRLRAFLEYHAVRGLYPSTALAPDMLLRTVNGNEVRVVAIQGGGLGLANPRPATGSGGFGAGGLNIMPPAVITQANIPASNGVIHVIGGPLIP